MNLSSRRTLTFSASLFTAALGLASAAAPAQAEQFVLFQQTFEITRATVAASGSHFYVRGAMLTQPPGNDWTKPIDYRNGTVYIQTEVLEKPASGEINHWSYCYMPNRPVGPGYGCAGSEKYTQMGVYAHPEKMTAWWQNTGISWPQGIKEMHLVIKGIGDSGHLHKRTDYDKLYPSRVRITMVQVSAGATFDPSKVPGWIASPAAGDGGAPEVGAPVADAGGGTGGSGGSGAGGAGGSGGSDGTGGASASGGAGGSSGAGSTGGAGGSGSNATGGTGSTTPPPSAGGSSGNAGSGAGSSTGGSSGSTGTGGSGTTPTNRSAPVTGGCNIASNATSPAPLALLALALAALRRRRR